MRWFSFTLFVVFIIIFFCLESPCYCTFLLITNSKIARLFSGDFSKHAEILRAISIIKYVYGYSACAHREIYFIVSVVLAQKILAGLGKVAERQSLVLWIYDVQKCTIALWFEAKDNKQQDWKSAQYFPQLRLKIRCLKIFQFIWNCGITLNID